MGNRGTKSVSPLLTVKAQRVDGSYIGINQPMLRYTLKSFERNLLVINAPPKLTNRSYHTISNKPSSKLDPWFITGFTDAEGCFTVILQKNTKVKSGYSVSRRFKISLHKKDLCILESLKAFFGVGSIQSAGKNRDSFEYVVKSNQDLNTVIIPHFDEYPLISQKKADYLLFKDVVTLMNNKEHLSVDGLLKIVNIKASINKGLSANLKAEFPQSKPYLRTLVGDPTIPHSS